MSRPVTGVWAGIRFSATVLVLLVLFFIALRTSVVDRNFVAPYTDLITRWSAGLLNLLGFAVTANGNVISSQEFSVSIMPVCNGLEVTAIFAAAVTAFPARLPYKLAGLVGGLALICAINLVRIAVLFIIGARNHVAFEHAHYYYAQAFVIVATACIWLAWMAIVSRHAPGNRRAVSS